MIWPSKNDNIVLKCLLHTQKKIMAAVLKNYTTRFFLAHGKTGL